MVARHRVLSVLRTPGQKTLVRLLRMMKLTECLVHAKTLKEGVGHQQRLWHGISEQYIDRQVNKGTR